MDEYVYAVLYEIFKLDDVKLIYKPCYVVKGIYDVYNQVFLDEINKLRYFLNDLRIFNDNDLCIGMIYTEKELKDKYPGVNNIEQLKLELFAEAEKNIVFGVYDKENKKINLSCTSNKSYTSGNYYKLEANHINENEFSIEDELINNIVIPISEKDNLIKLNDEDLEGYFDYLIQNQEYMLKDAFNYEGYFTIEKSLFYSLYNKKDYKKIKKIMIKAFDTILNTDFSRYFDKDKRIAYDEIKDIVIEFYDNIMEAKKLDEINKYLYSALLFNKKVLEGFLSTNKINKYKNCISYFKNQIKRISEIIKLQDINLIKENYNTLFNETINDLVHSRCEMEDNIKIVELDSEQLAHDEENDYNDLVDDTMSKLNSLIGLNNVKDTFDNIFSIMIFKKKTEDNLVFENDSKHLAFIGNPGTGKTTVANIIAPFFYKMGYLRTDKVSFIESQDLIAGYVGQTALKTEEVIEKNKGGLIVLDEAYILANSAQRYGNEAIAVILKEMEKNDTMFIFAGYKKEMRDFINMNSGLKSRIANYIEFKDYTENELYEIFEQTVTNTAKDKKQKLKLTIDNDAKIKIKEIIHEASLIDNFGNGRFIKNLFNYINREHAKNTRYIDEVNKLYLITESDIPSDVLDKILFRTDEDSQQHIGFNTKKYVKKSK